MMKAAALESSNDALVVKSKRLPTTSRKREYRELDDLWRCGKVLFMRIHALSRAIASGAPPDLAEVEQVDVIVESYFELVDFYNRDELFEPTKGKRLTPNLLDVYEDRVISRRAVSEQVALLIGSFPNAAPHAPKMYTGMLIEEIIAAKPCPISLEAALRDIRRTKTFAPTAAEVLERLRARMQEWSDYHEMIADWHDVKQCIVKRLPVRGAA